MASHRLFGLTLLLLASTLVLCKLLFGWVIGIASLRTLGNAPDVMVPATGLGLLLAHAAIMLSLRGKPRAAMQVTFAMIALVAAVIGLQAAGLKGAGGFFLVELTQEQQTAPLTACAFCLLGMLLIGLNARRTRDGFVQEVLLITGIIICVAALAVNIYDPNHHLILLWRGTSNATALLFLLTFGAVMALFFPPVPRDREAF